MADEMHAIRYCLPAVSEWFPAGTRWTIDPRPNYQVVQAQVGEHMHFVFFPRREDEYSPVVYDVVVWRDRMDGSGRRHRRERASDTDPARALHDAIHEFDPDPADYGWR